MKHSIAVFFRFLAILAVMLLGITAILPQSTIKDDKKYTPEWRDIDPKTDTDIMALYEKGIITGGTNGEFGVNEPFTVSEAAYATVRIYEIENKIEYSFKYYTPENGEDYITRAKQYDLWIDSLPESGEPLTREEFTAVISKLTEGEEISAGITKLMNADKLTYPAEVLRMYNLGIMLERNSEDSFSPEMIITRGEAVRLVTMYLEPEKRIEIVIPDYVALETQLTEKMAEWQGDWSLYFEDIKTGHQISINSHQMYSASLIKLFVAQTVYQKVASGEMAMTTKLEDEIRKMITYSDNDAWKYIARALGGGTYSKGMAAVTETAQGAGFADTGTFYKGNHKNYNFTSVNDCGAYLRGILNGTIVNAQYSEKILELLKQQQHLQKIPSGIPDTVVTANKTGELDYIQGDAAIVYAPNGTYILVIIGDGLEDGYGQVSKFTELSEMVYEHLN